MHSKKHFTSDQDIILDSINEGVFTVGPDWRITSMNRAAEEITGVPRADALGRPCREVFKADVCEKSCPLRETVKTGQPVVNATCNIESSSGLQVPIRISTAILRDEEGRIMGGVETFQDLSVVAQLQKELESRYTFEDIIGRSPALMDLFDILPQIAQSNSTVFLEGASGTGKELFARAIHNISPRRKHRLVAVNCAALPDNLLESELFGHKAGAFTDAKRDKPGRFALAHKGTIFLDEIGDISPAMQAKLLRVLQDRIIEPLGSVQPIHVDVRVIAATNQDLSKLVQNGNFREDLFYRIRVIHLRIPELKERREDIPLLINHILARLNRLQGKDIKGLSDDVMDILMQHEYPGNVRQLENIIEHAFVLCRSGLIQLHHLPPELRKTWGGAVDSGPTSLKKMEMALISEALERSKGNRKLASSQLGINPSTLYRKMKALRIACPVLGVRKKKRTLQSAMSLDDSKV